MKNGTTAEERFDPLRDASSIAEAKEAVGFVYESGRRPTMSSFMAPQLACTEFDCVAAIGPSADLQVDFRPGRDLNDDRLATRIWSPGCATSLLPAVKITAAGHSHACRPIMEGQGESVSHETMMSDTSNGSHLTVTAHGLELADAIPARTSLVNHPVSPDRMVFHLRNAPRLATEL